MEEESDLLFFSFQASLFPFITERFSLFLFLHFRSVCCLDGRIPNFLQILLHSTWISYGGPYVIWFV